MGWSILGIERNGALEALPGAVGRSRREVIQMMAAFSVAS